MKKVDQNNQPIFLVLFSLWPRALLSIGVSRSNCARSCARFFNSWPLQLINARKILGSSQAVRFELENTNKIGTTTHSNMRGYVSIIVVSTLLRQTWAKVSFRSFFFLETVECKIFMHLHSHNFMNLDTKSILWIREITMDIWSNSMGKSSEVCF